MGRPRSVSDSDVLAAIRRSSGLGVPLSMRELAAELGFRSPAPLYRYLERLKREGKVISDPGKARSLRAVG